MSSPELLTIVVGLVVGYWIISRLMGARTPRPAAGGADATSAGPHQQGQPEGVNHEWISANWHEVLGVSPKASIEVIRSAYRLRAHQYHPDKTEGLGPELRTLAAQKMQELNLAYARATRSQRGR